MRKCARNLHFTLVALALGLSPVMADAQSNSAESRVGHWYIGGGFGAFSEESNSQLPNQDPGAALFFSGGYRASPNVAVEADWLGWDQDFATPATVSAQLSGAQGRTELVASGVGAVIKFFAPLNAIDLYGGAGLGFYAINLNVQGAGDSEIDETESELGFQALVGADVYIAKKMSVGLEYRWVKLDSDFSPYLNGNIDVGGQFFLMNIRGHF